MEFTIRPAKREDCPAMLELIRELAVFERAPDEVTVSPEHFEECGFGENPIWWAFVACAPSPKPESAGLEAAAEESVTSVQDPVLAQLMSEPAPATSGDEQLEIQNVTDGLPVSPVIQLDEAIESTIPEPVLEAFPLMQEDQHCEQVIGFALYYMRYSTWKGQRMYLEDLLVTERWRCKGVGTALMDALIGAAKANGLHGISWQVLEWNEDAIRFYKRYGSRFDREWVNVAIDV